MVITEEILDKYHKSLVLRNLSPRTIRSYMYDIIQMNNVGGLKDSNSILDFFTTMKEDEDIGDHRFSGLVTSLRSFMRYAHPRKIISEDFYLEAKSIKPVPKGRRKTKLELIAYTDSQSEKLLISARENYGEYVRNIFWLALKTGLRKRALLSLLMSDIDTSGDLYQIHVRPEIDKGHNERYIPFNLDNTTELERIFNLRKITHAKTSCVLITKKGKAFNQIGGGIDDIYSTLSKKLGFRVTLHNCRYTMGSNVWISSGDLYLTQYLLGHKNPDQTAAYLKIQAKEMRKQVSLKMRDVKI